MQKRRSGIFEIPAVLVLLSFLFGLSNFVDTSLRLLFTFMLTIPYPSELNLKPAFFVLQVACLALFIYYIRNRNRSFARAGLGDLLTLQLAVLVTIVFLFLLELLNPAMYGLIYYVGAVWLLVYVLGLSLTSFWFFSKLRQERSYQALSTIFLLIGLAFISTAISEIYLWPQTFLNIALPPEGEVGSRLLTTVLIAAAPFIARALLSFRRRIAKPSTSLLKNTTLYAVIAASLVPFFLNNYKEGLFPLIIRTIVYWGLGYSGQDWYFTSLYLAALVVYLSLIINLHRRLDHSTASNLILLGAVSFPWNGIMVFDFGYSSIAGNMLSLSALIVGFFLRKEESKTN